MTHREGFLSKVEADALYQLCVPLPFYHEQGYQLRVAYGVNPPYQKLLSPDIPEFLSGVVAKVSAFHAVNYVHVQIIAPDRQVIWHTDAGFPWVSMLTMGQIRTFHAGDKAFVMRHGDLLTFEGATKHWMEMADKDPAFDPNGYDSRVSVLFRHTDLSLFRRKDAEPNEKGVEHRADAPEGA